MKYRRLIDRAFSLTFRNFSLWVVAVVLSAVQVIAPLIFANANVIFLVFNLLVELVIAAMMSGALIWMANSLSEKRQVGVGAGLKAGMAYFVRMLGVQLLIMLPIWIVLVLWTGSLLSIFGALGQPGDVSFTNLDSLFGSFSIMLVVLMLLGLFLAAIQIGAERAVVLEGASVLAAIKRGWLLLGSHFGNYIVLSLIILLITLAIGLLFQCGASIFFAIGTDTSASPDSSLGARTVIDVIIGLLEGGLSQILFSAIWTLAFRFWQGKDVAAPVLPPVTSEAVP